MRAQLGFTHAVLPEQPLPQVPQCSLGTRCWLGQMGRGKERLTWVNLPQFRQTRDFKVTFKRFSVLSPRPAHKEVPTQKHCPLTYLTQAKSTKPPKPHAQEFSPFLQAGSTTRAIGLISSRAENKTA